MSESKPQFDADMPGRDQEAGLIGAVLRRPALFTDLAEVIGPDAFGYAPYRQAWEAMIALADRDHGIDALTVGDELDRRGNLAGWTIHSDKTTAGRFSLSKMREQGQPQNARAYAENVKDYSAKRQITEIMSLGATWAANGRRASDILTDLEKRLQNVDAGAVVSKNTVTLHEAVRQAATRTEMAARGEIEYIPSGYPELDEIITGFSQPDFTIIAGRPGQGKTALLASIAGNILKTGKKVVFFSLEMSSEQVGTRFISMLSGVSYQKQQTGKLSFDEWNAYNAAVEQLGSDSGLYLNDLPAITPNRIRQELRRLWPVDMVMVDYLQLAGADQRYEARHLEVGAIAYAFKSICKEFTVPMIAAAQLSRESEKRSAGEKTPILSDLGESGKLEQAADKVIFIHRPTDNGPMADIIIPKQRNGPTGRITLTYQGERTRFVSQREAK